jgi:malonyl-CoA O-methyltransferase
MNTADAYALDQQLVRRRFAQKAGKPALDATLEDEIGSRLLEHLDPIKVEPRQVLDIGSGSGVTLLALRDKYPRANFVGLDCCFPMLMTAATQLSPTLPTTQLVCADIAQTGLRSASVDLLFSNLTLNWCTDINAAIEELHRILRPGGLLMLSVLGPDTLSELRNSWAQIDSGPHVQQFPDMHDIGDNLTRTGFADIVIDAERLTLEYKNIERLFGDLRDWGVGNVCQGRARSLTRRKDFEAMTAAYETLRRPNNTLPATCEVAYVHAWLPQQRGVSIPVADFNPLRRRR